MVIFGGLELVAAGYIIHKHSKNKKEKRRLEEEAAALEEQQYRIYPSPPPHRRHHSHDRRHSRDRKHRNEAQVAPGQPPYINGSGAGNVYAEYPPRANSVPPTYPQNGWYAPGPAGAPAQQTKPYPPSGYPQNYPNQDPNAPQYGQYPAPGFGPSQSMGDLGRGRQDRRAEEAVTSPHVRFAGPDGEEHGRFSPPPEYRP